jgi:DNA helicase-2/ATP-dependent DNA helicase PcrA
MAGAGFRSGLSSFIRDLPDGIVSYESGGQKRVFSRPRTAPGPDYNRAGMDKALNVDSNDRSGSAEFCQGEKVRHPAFGFGVVSKSVENDKIEVIFKAAGRKLLHLEYTTLEKM